jgi:hypothetical protein
MDLSPGQAAESLKEIERTQRRSAEAHEYVHASPGFILWGLIWMVGYTGSYMLPNYGFINGISWLWFVLVVAGVFANATLDRRRYRGQSPERVAAGKAIGRRIGMTFLALYAFIFATFSVMRPVNPVVSAAFIPLLVAVIYAIYGIWRGLRFLIIGIVVAALTMGGWFYLPQHFLLWMAAVGGGSLILVGLWLRKV